MGGGARWPDVTSRNNGPPTIRAALDEEHALFQQHSLAVLWH